MYLCKNIISRVIVGRFKSMDCHPVRKISKISAALILPEIPGRASLCQGLFFDLPSR